MNKEFQLYIKNSYGVHGQTWLNALPTLIEQATAQFKLSHLKVVPNLTCNLVFSGFQEQTPIILKLSMNHHNLSKEAFALKCFASFGAVNVLAEDNGLLLMQHAIPGTSLKNHFPSQDKEAVQITCNLIKKLHQASIPKDHNFPHIKDWLAALDNNHDIETRLLIKARILRDKLLKSANADVLLHGDLHHDNILKHDDNWIVIDPKGIIGDPAYEIGAFIRNPIPELINQENAVRMIQERINLFAAGLNLAPERIAAWCFVQTILVWIWSLEDHCDPQYWKQLALITDQL
jgi:streptomycin 6-kinase